MGPLNFFFSCLGLLFKVRCKKKKKEKSLFLHHLILINKVMKYCAKAWTTGNMLFFPIALQGTFVPELYLLNCVT